MPATRRSGYEDSPWLPELYDHTPGYVGRPDLGFYVGCARRACGPVLELGCGTGRVLIPVARAGREIVGLDLSRHMLDRCRRKVEDEPPEVRARIRLVRGNMTNFALGRRFALVTTPFRAFQHLVTVREQMACLQCVRCHLKAGGTFILDLFHPDLQKLSNPVLHEEQQEFAGVALPGGRAMRRTHRIAAFHRARQCNDVEIIYYVTRPTGRTERLVHAFPFRYFSRYEVEHLLARCGFRVRDVFGGFDRSPLRDDSPEMIFVAVKSTRD